MEKALDLPFLLPRLLASQARGWLLRWGGCGCHREWGYPPLRSLRGSMTCGAWLWWKALSPAGMLFPGQRRSSPLAPRTRTFLWGGALGSFLCTKRRSPNTAFQISENSDELQVHQKRKKVAKGQDAKGCASPHPRSPFDTSLGCKQEGAVSHSGGRKQYVQAPPCPSAQVFAGGLWGARQVVAALQSSLLWFGTPSPQSIVFSWPLMGQIQPPPPATMVQWLPGPAFTSAPW